MSIGKRFKEFRFFLHLSQTDISKSLGLSGAFISHLENNKANPSLHTLIKLQNKYNLDINWLLTGNGNIILNKTNPTNQSTKQLLNINEMLLEDNSRLSKTINDLLQKYVLKVEE